jgi:hypothetical protein
MGEKCIKDLVGNPEGKRPLRRHRCRLVDNFKTNLKGTELESVDRILCFRIVTNGRFL